MSLTIALLALAALQPGATTPRATPQDCAVLVAVARADPSWGPGAPPRRQLWNGNGEFDAACDWERAGLMAPVQALGQGGPLFWFSKPWISPDGARAQDVFADVVPGPPPAITYHLCRLTLTATGWRLASACSISRDRPPPGP